MPTLNAYDKIPYSDCPFPETHPENLCVTGRLFGIDSALPDRCRVLEIGCANGGNLIPMAYYWPDSEFVGIELSEKQVAQASHIIEDLQLTNIKIINDSILSVDDSLGKFDYIIAHGVYSWVPDEVREKLLKMLHDLLESNGIGYISYNTYPGWHNKQVIRSILYYHNRNAESVEQKVERSFQILKMLEEGIPDDSSQSENLLKTEVKQLLKLTPDYLLHDILEDYNKPVFFHEFMRHAEKHQLQYLADAHLYTMLGSTLTESAEAALDEIEDLIEYEQYMDIFYVRSFRQSLLCHDSVEISREMDVDVFQQCYFSTFLACDEEIDLNSTQSQLFKDQSGTTFSISHPLTKIAVVELSQIYPNSCLFSQLLDRSQTILSRFGSELDNDSPDNLLSELFNLYLSQGVHASVVRREFNTGLSEQPKASALAQVYAQLNKCCIASVHHDSCASNTVINYMISLMNGNNTIEEIVNAILVKAEHDGQFSRQLCNSFKLQDLNNMELITRGVEQCLYHLATHGLLNN